ncbi:MAG: sulfur carrier protein ThiS [Ruminococcus flavefaciens]|nr:sulfur carrier protein ThiS [Ruminococcus sp.]OPZ22436.1 MAG: Sulfur carrier protein ThiS [Firmicutes bacterium ADurb.BinA205]HOC33951.1 sulfur carrier protein ThiS [Ruminococcus flavefaciens]HQM02199.1 sulfur carrier protein ThiS [Ruminococcus flavefaciens]
MVKVNGEMMDMDGKTVAELLEAMDAGSQRVAVELNMDIVPRASYGETLLKDGDSVEVVRFVGGG